MESKDRLTGWLRYFLCNYQVGGDRRYLGIWWAGLPWTALDSLALLSFAAQHCFSRGRICRPTPGRPNLVLARQPDSLSLSELTLPHPAQAF